MFSETIDSPSVQPESPSEFVHSRSPLASDAIGVFGFGSDVIGLCGVAATLTALADSQGSGRTRTLAGALGLGAVAFGGLARRASRRGKPPLLTRFISENPRWTAAACTGVVGVAPLVSRRATAAHFVPAAAAAVLGATIPRRGGLIGVGAAGYLGAGLGVRLLRAKDWKTDERVVLALGIAPLVLAISTPIGGSLALASREVGLLDAFLNSIERERNDLLTLRPEREALYRDALGRLEGFADAWSTDTPDEVERDLIQRGRGRVREALAVLEAADGTASDQRPLTVSELTTARINDFRGDGILEIEDALFEGDEHGLLDVRTREMLARGLCVALSNAQRHGTGTVRTTVKLTDEMLDVVVVNGADGAAAATAAAGLSALRNEAELFNGTVESAPHDPNQWRFRLQLPIEHTIVLPPGDRTVERVIDSFTKPLRFATIAMAVMVLHVALDGRQTLDRRRARGLAFGTVGTYLAADVTGALGLVGVNGRTRESSAVSRGMQIANAGVALLTTHRGEHPLFTGWANVSLARHGLRSGKRELAALTAINVLATALSFRGDARQLRILLTTQLPIVILGPVAMARAVTDARIRLTTKERDLRAGLGDIELEQDQLERLREAHDVMAPLKQLSNLYRSVRPELAETIDELFLDVDRLLARYPGAKDGHQLAQELAQTLGRHVWPVPVELKIVGDDIYDIPPQATSSMHFRRRAANVIARAGDVFEHAFERDLVSRPRLERVEMLVAADTTTARLEVRLEPITDKQHLGQDQMARLKDALAYSHGDLTSLDGTGLTFRLSYSPVSYVITGPENDHAH